MTRQRRRTPRTYIALAASFAIVGSLAACSGGGSGSTTPSGNKTLTMWTFKQSHVTALQNAAKSFKAKTGVAVNVQAITPDDAFITKVQAAAQSRNLPDIFEVHTNGDDFTFGAAGLLENLASHVDKKWTSRYLDSVAVQGTVTKEYFQQSLAQGSKTQGIAEGQRYSVPLTIGTFGIVYANKKRLAAAGITKAPATWEEFIADLDAVKKTNPKDGGVSIGLQSSTTGLEWLMQPMAYGMLGADDFHALFSKDPSKNFRSATGTAVLKTYNQITPYWMPGTQSLTIDNADIAFAQGKSAFDIGGTFTLAFLAQNKMDTNNVLAFPVPAPKNGAIKNLSLSPFGLTGLSVSATSKNKDSAIAWLNHLAEPAVAAQFAHDSLDVPPVDLGKDSSAALGPVLGAMIDSFGEGADAYNPGDTSYRPNAYDAPKVGDPLMELTPLKLKDAPTTGAKIATIIDSFWKLS